jgi:antitoxin ParD1/3/4
MAMVKKSITITDQQEDWIQVQMATGNYGTDSELIREALREKQNRVTETEYIRAKLIASEQSGFTDLTRDKILEKSKEELRRNGEL